MWAIFCIHEKSWRMNWEPEHCLPVLLLRNCKDFQRNWKNEQPNSHWAYMQVNISKSFYLLEMKDRLHTQVCTDSHHRNSHCFNLERKIWHRQRGKWGCSWLLPSCALGHHSTCHWLLVHEVEEAHVSLPQISTGCQFDAYNSALRKASYMQISPRKLKNETVCDSF